ncbi:MAG TPA: autotransporter outer membrane beta-barrel domain-containing protein [Rhabdochlamydiaceae bacterium]|nr:autotransporter outer membrane beta-barrel domain-containing protein [Rhabdochlamydiaceae bacterium]
MFSRKAIFVLSMLSTASLMGNHVPVNLAPEDRTIGDLSSEELTLDRGSHLTLTNTNSCKGPISIVNGTLQLGTSSALAPTADVMIAEKGTLVNPPGVSNTAHHIYNAGTLVAGSKISAQTYTQTGTLQLDVSALPGGIGNISTEGAATIGNTLVLNALPGSNIQPGQTVDLITAAGGISGTFSKVDYLNFPLGLTPNLIYQSNNVQFLLDLEPVSTIVSPTTIGSAVYIPMTAVNITNFELGNQLMHLSSRIINLHEWCYKQGHSRDFDAGYKERYNAAYTKASKAHNKTAANCEEDILVAEADPLIPTLGNIDQVPSQERQLGGKVAAPKHDIYPSRFYIGPLDSFGTVKSRGVDQIGCDYNSLGFLTGYDYAFRHWGLGLACEYTYTTATNHQKEGHFNLHHVHESLYATWVPSSLKYLIVNGIVGGSFDVYHFYRKTGTSLTPFTAKAATLGTGADALMEAEYIFSHLQFKTFPRNLRLIPLLNVQYIWMDVTGFIEKNASYYAIQVNSQQIQSLRSSLGLRLDYAIRRKHITFLPELVVAWQREFLDHSRDIHFKTVNMPVVQSASVKNMGAGRDTLLLELDFLLTIKKVFEIEARYDFQWNSMYRNNTFYLGIGGNF